MTIAALPLDENERLEKLRSTGLLDSEREVPFDNAVKLASLICGAPIALVSLVAENRQWFKSRVGLATNQTSRDVAFCAHALTLDEPLVVQDAREDVRFFDNPLVAQDPSIRFYAGVPLHVRGGSAIGTLCVIDRVPRKLSSQQLEGLSILARQVESEIESRLESARRSSTQPPPTDRRLSSISGLSPLESIDADASTLPLQRTIEESGLPTQPGDVVGGRYVIQAVLGRGSMGIVMKANDLASGGTVAIKILLDTPTTENERLIRFIREARLLSTLQSPHITHIVDVGNLPDGSPFIAMEYVEGRSLEALLREQPVLDASLAHEILCQAAKGAAIAHTSGIIHRDLKPSNLMLVANGSGILIKLLDFGVAKGPFDGDLMATMAHDLVGTVPYMAPEQVLGAPTVDARSDIWALGCIGYEMLTGGLPFDGETMVQVCSKILLGQVTPITERAPSVPSGLAAIITRCIALDADQRYPAADALVDALSNLQ